MASRSILVVVVALGVFGCRSFLAPVAIETVPTSDAAPRVTATVPTQLPELLDLEATIQGQHLVVQARLELHGWTVKDFEQAGGWHLSGVFAGTFGNGITHFIGHQDGRFVVLGVDETITGRAHVHVTSNRFRMMIPLAAIDADDEAYWSIHFWHYPVGGYGGGGRSYGGIVRR